MGGMDPSIVRVTHLELRHAGTRPRIGARVAAVANGNCKLAPVKRSLRRSLVLRSSAIAVLISAVLGTLALVGCSTPPARPLPPRPEPPPLVQRYERAGWSQLPGWSNDRVQEAWQAFLASCRAMRFKQEWVAPCSAAQTVPGGSDASIRAYFEQNFEPFKVMKYPSPTREDRGLVTGYYEPQLQGSRQPTAQFMAPLYATPPDLLVVDLAALYPELKGKRIRGRLEGNRVVPYYSRAELPTDPAIRGKEIVWLDSALDAFMLQVQGSGRVQLPTGEVIRLQFADQNGHPYRSIGRYLVDQGLLATDQATMPGIRAWLAANPARMQEVLNANPSVVFFSEVALDDPSIGPKGAQGVPLTAERSIAVDPAFVPLGTPVFLATTFPASEQPLQRLVVAQDTGGAINGSPRADYFWGTGPVAAEQAGKMRQQGSLWLLWPKNVPLPAG
jgi:membrane-bound lytic murein transglycosylase A